MDLALNGPQLWAVERLQPGNTVWMPWGRGVGKSWFLRTAMWLLIAQYDQQIRRNALKPFRGIRVIVLMPTLKQFKDVHGAGIIDELENEWSWLGGKIDRTTWTITFPGGSWIKPFPSSEYNSRTARGMRADVIVTDESDDIDPGVFDSVALPWFSEPWSLRIRIGGGTPRRGRYGLLWRNHKLGTSQDPQDARYHSLHATWEDAPETVSEDAVRDAERTTPKAIFRREWLCDFDAAEGLVYPFDESVHVRIPDERIWFTSKVVGADWGWSDPGVFLDIGVTGHGKDSALWVLDEVYESEKPNGWWDSKAKAFAKAGQRKFYCDPSRPDRIADLRAAGCNPVGADNDIEHGVSRVAELLFVREDEAGNKRTRLFVHPRCVNTIREFNSYRRKRDPKQADAYLEAIEDRNNHAMDALRYAAVGLFGLAGGTKYIEAGR